MAKELKDLYSVNDKRAVFMSVKERQGEKISLIDVAADSGVRAAQARYVVDLLVKWGYLEKICILNMGPKYKRFTYKVIKEYDDYTEYDEDEEYSLYATPMIPVRRER